MIRAIAHQGCCSRIRDGWQLCGTGLRRRANNILLWMCKANCSTVHLFFFFSFFCRCVGGWVGGWVGCECVHACVCTYSMPPTPTSYVKFSGSNLQHASTIKESTSFEAFKFKKQEIQMAQGSSQPILARLPNPIALKCCKTPRAPGKRQPCCSKGYPGEPGGQTNTCLFGLVA